MVVQKMVRGIRGAITVAENTEGAILSSTRELLESMVKANQIAIDDIAAVHFSATRDLDKAFPARAARMIGWRDVPLFCHVEIDVPAALPLCIRVLMLVNTDQKPSLIKHIYLGQSYLLREDKF